VDFEALDGEAVYDAFGLPPHSDDEGGEDEEAPKPARPFQKPSFMIWTTTPWTLPANLAIAVNEKVIYALVKVDGSYTVLAEGLVEKVTKAAGAEEVEIVATKTGDKLVGLRYRHPFVEGGPDFATQPEAAMRGSEPEGIYRVVQADYVTLEDGTGLVHTAPGHGSEDYMTGLREKLPVYCPVRANGTYDDSVPAKYRGLSVWDANEQITKDLQSSGHLFHSNRFMHSYPHDWRSKTPVIFRATEQWFIGVDEPAKTSGRTLREHALVVCLWASPEAIWERVRHQTHRPLLQTADPLSRIRELLAEREPHYRQADILVHTEMRTAREVAHQVVSQYRAASAPAPA